VKAKETPTEPFRGPEPELNSLERPFGTSEIQAFVNVLRVPDEALVDAHVQRWLDRGVSAERLLIELVTPAARRIGEEWMEDSCDFVDVTLVTGRLQRIVRGTSAAMNGAAPTPEEDRPRVLLTSLAGHAHTLGMLLVAEFFRAASWNVHLGAPFDSRVGSEIVADRFVHVVGLSMSLVETVPQVREEVRRIRRRSRNPKVGILLGGPALLENPALADEIGADGFTLDASLAPQLAAGFL
jgi:MerR family transcriptional regulator, light-induced transcriptional regulator